MNEDDMKEMQSRFQQAEAGHLLKDADPMGAFNMRYGFDHDCKCEEQYAEGDLELVSTCFCEMAEEAMLHLESLRGAIFGIIASGSDDADEIKRVLTEQFYGEHTEGGTH